MRLAKFDFNMDKDFGASGIPIKPTKQTRMTAMMKTAFHLRFELMAWAGSGLRRNVLLLWRAPPLDSGETNRAYSRNPGLATPPCFPAGARPQRNAILSLSPGRQYEAERHRLQCPLSFRTARR